MQFFQLLVNIAIFFVNAFHALCHGSYDSLQA
jgi:hypothetical protein